MLHLNSSTIAIGQTPPQDMGGLWDTRQFQGTFPPFPNLSKVRVIVTPNFNTAWDPSKPGAAPVCIITELSAANFTAQATNTSEQGTSGPTLSLNWLAIEEVAPTATLPINVRMGLTIPQFYVPQHFPQSNEGWWQQTSPSFASPLRGEQTIVLLTPTDPFGSFKHSAAIAGTVHKPGSSGFQMAGISTDSATGACAFNYVAAAAIAGSDQPTLIVDTGEVTSAEFPPPDNGPGNNLRWFSLGIPFTRRFDAPPIVLVTASSVGLPSPPPPVVALVSHVTDDYFILNTRYTHTGSGFIQPANFFWVAIGCNAGCGQGPGKVP